MSDAGPSDLRQYPNYSAKRCKADMDQATFTNPDFWAYGLSRADGSEEFADLGLEALVFVGEQLR
jgi:hypothetical protein